MCKIYYIVLNGCTYKDLELLCIVFSLTDNPSCFKHLVEHRSIVR